MTAAAPPPATTTATAAPRVGNLDVLRAVAAFAVLGVHAYALGGRAAPVRAQHGYDVPLIGLAGGVWLFFAISGYVIARPFVDRLATGRQTPRAGAYALRRILRIYPLYWIGLSAVLAIDGVDNARPWQLAFHYALLNNFIPGQQESVFSTAWTLTVEVLFYASVPLLAAALARRRRSPERLAALLLCSWVASIAFTAIADLLGDGSTALWMRFFFPAMWQGFCPGILLALAPHLRAPRWRVALRDFPRTSPALVAIGALVVAGAVLSADSPLRFGLAPYELLTDASRVAFELGFGLLVARALQAGPWSRHGRPLLELGLASYGVYLIHPVVASFMLAHGLEPMHRDTLAAYLVNLIVLCAVTIPLALASWRWLEQPAIALARRLGGGAGRPASAAAPPHDASSSPPDPAASTRSPSTPG
jgi:peptidoglycan/LPS O-acetylase OafA/YrhL